MQDHQLAQKLEMNVFYDLVKQLRDDQNTGDSAPEPENPDIQLQHQIVSVTDVETADFLTARGKTDAKNDQI